MKTTKVILVAALMVLATMGFSQAENQSNFDKQTPPTLEVKISLMNALQNAALVSAMRSQLNPDFLHGQLRVYTVKVRLDQTIFHIWGTHRQWEKFFRIEAIAPRPD